MMARDVLAETNLTRFLVLADFLVPAYGAMPSFSSVVPPEAIRASLNFRPDVHEAFARGLADCTESRTPEANLDALSQADREAFDAISLIVAGTYYMQPAVRAAIHYPGQENVSYDAMATPLYLLDGSLGEVIARGRKYKPTPGLEDR
ncbi:hypothetical protein BH10PSE7_BH10PSE7_18120 [soil metagenome]